MPEDREREAETGEGRVSGRSSGTIVGAALAELVGTYMLVFFGTATVAGVLLAAPDSPPDVTAISLAFGFAVLVVVYAFGHVSGAHVNPAVTLGLAAARKFPLSAVPAYIAAQFVGAILASLTVWALFGAPARSGPIFLGATAPGGSALAALLAEFVITFVLLIVVMATATDERATSPAAGLGIGFTIAIGVFATLPISGGSFNPARSLGPMIVSGSFVAWWVYVIGPLVGGVAGALVYEFALRPGSPPDTKGTLEEQPKSEDESM